MKIRNFTIALLALLFTLPAFGQNLYQPTPNVFPQYTYASGVPVALGWVCAYESGTTNKLDTYTTPAGTANTNPVHLDSGGRADIYLKPQAYTLKLYAPGVGSSCGTQAVGALIKSVDNVLDPAELFTTAFSTAKLNNVRMCDQFAGATGGAKIAACIADLPSTGGTADARGLEGAQTITADPFSGVTKPVDLMLGAGTFVISSGLTSVTSVTIHAGSGAIISPNGGVVVTIAGGFEGTLSQHFAGAGTIEMTSTRMTPVYPQWWGALANDSHDDTAAIQAAVYAAGDCARSTAFVMLPRGLYYSAAGITISSCNQVDLRGPGAIISVHSDVEPLTLNACRDWHIDSIAFETSFTTTGAAFHAANGSIGGRYDSFRTESNVASTKFKYGVLSDGSYIANYYSPYTDEYSVSNTGMLFKDSSGIGTYAPAAILVSGPNIGAGVTGIQIESASDFLIEGGTVEDNSSTKNIYIKNSAHVSVHGTHTEVPLTTSSNVYVEGSRFTTLTSYAKNGALVTVRSSTSTTIDNLGPLANYDVDVNSHFTVIFGGQPNSSNPGTGYYAELGTNTYVIGQPEADNGDFVQIRTNGALLFRIRAGTGIAAGGLEWAGDTDLFRNSAGNLRTTSNLSSDGNIAAGLSSGTFTARGAAGVTTTLSCSGGQAIKTLTVTGGIVTAVTCAAP